MALSSQCRYSYLHIFICETELRNCVHFVWLQLQLIFFFQEESKYSSISLSEESFNTFYQFTKTSKHYSQT